MQLSFLFSLNNNILVTFDLQFSIDMSNGFLSSSSIVLIVDSIFSFLIVTSLIEPNNQYE